MRGNLNYTGVVGSGTFEPLPAGQYLVEIARKEDKTSTNGDPQVRLRLKVMSGEYAGRLIFDQVTLIPGGKPGAGFAKNFLRCIEEPCDGDFEFDSDRWVGKKLIVTVKIDEQYNSNKVESREPEGLPF